jgi:hypothetical protein
LGCWSGRAWSAFVRSTVVRHVRRPARAPTNIARSAPARCSAVALRLCEAGSVAASPSGAATSRSDRLAIRRSDSGIGIELTTCLPSGTAGVGRARMQELVGEVADLANEAAAAELIWAGGFAALTTCVIAVFAFAQEHGAGATLTKASLTIPVLAFAAYISRLAAIHRRQAWRWRHIELQISTARPGGRRHATTRLGAYRLSGGTASSPPSRLVAFATSTVRIHSNAMPLQWASSMPAWASRRRPCSC